MLTLVYSMNRVIGRVLISAGLYGDQIGDWTVCHDVFYRNYCPINHTHMLEWVSSYVKLTFIADNACW